MSRAFSVLVALLGLALSLPTTVIAAGFHSTPRTAFFMFGSTTEFTGFVLPSWEDFGLISNGFTPRVQPGSAAIQDKLEAAYASFGFQFFCERAVIFQGPQFPSDLNVGNVVIVQKLGKCHAP